MLPDTSESETSIQEISLLGEEDAGSDLAVQLLRAWRLDDLMIMEDAGTFWRHLRALPPQVSPEERAKELCVVAYVGDQLVGVSTVSLELHPRLRARVGVFRCLVSPEYVHRRLAKRLTDYSRLVLEEWSRENPHERVLGMLFVLESPKFDLLEKRPVWRGSNDAHYWLIGFTPKGQQIRLTWFKHARLD
jgi:hypothetical protein